MLLFADCNDFLFSLFVCKSFFCCFRRKTKKKHFYLQNDRNGRNLSATKKKETKEKKIFSGNESLSVFDSFHFCNSYDNNNNNNDGRGWGWG